VEEGTCHGVAKRKLGAWKALAHMLRTLSESLWGLSGASWSFNQGLQKKTTGTGNVGPTEPKM